TTCLQALHYALNCLNLSDRDFFFRIEIEVNQTTEVVHLLTLLISAPGVFLEPCIAARDCAGLEQMNRVRMDEVGFTACAPCIDAASVKRAVSRVAIGEGLGVACIYLSGNGIQVDTFDAGSRPGEILVDH